ncbi:MAG TPA: SHOCT domain-containing protein [Conexibacter sp.]
MGLMANRAATRMQTRQMYRTASRMQRRRSWGEARMGQRQDFAPADEPGADASQQTAPAAEPEQPAYLAELEQLSRLRDQGVISADEFDAKKRQLLGI